MVTATIRLADYSAIFVLVSFVLRIVVCMCSAHSSKQILWLTMFFSLDLLLQ